MSSLSSLLQTYRDAAVSEREKGTYFEELIRAYLRNEAAYRDLYSDVWTYQEWAAQQGLDQRDTGIDLVARTRGTGEYHAIQCKFYAPGHTVQKRDIDSFFTASGRRPFTHRIIVSTTNLWGEHAEEALRDQQPPVSRIDLHDLETSQIDWARYKPDAPVVLAPKKTLRPHQQSALEAVVAGLSKAGRGKLIMACGTGKTFTSLKIAEQMAGAGGRVLFLVPSLSLLSQTLTEWTQESTLPLHSFAVCSDSDVGKKRSADDDRVQTFVHELRYPATTNAQRLAGEMSQRHDAEHMSVVFSTYHSIEVIHRAQHEFDLADFDLIICDEAHRTTGASHEGEEESAFVRVHDEDFIRAARRLYMTATPRIYADTAKVTAEQDNVALYSMDNEAHYGKELFVITFSEAVKRGLLVDYKVIVLAVEETHVNRRLQRLLADEDNQLKVDDAARIVGCWKALAKQGLSDALDYDAQPMKRAVAFCQVIRPTARARRHQVASVNIAAMFKDVVDAYQAAEEFETRAPSVTLNCEAAHIDGSMNAGQKEEKLSWLKADTPPGTCRILSNVRCLSEGVDVPALDAVLFLTPRNSQVDVVQSVGRVMRTAPGKKMGYVVLPVVIPAGVEAHEALNDNETYRVVWQVLQALRSHDDRFDAMINKLDLIGRDTSKMEVIAITDRIQPRQDARAAKGPSAKGGYSLGTTTKLPMSESVQIDLQFEIGEIERAIYAKLVEKVGNRHHWEDWARDIAQIANTHIDRITAIVGDPANTLERQAFDTFAAELRDDINDSVSDAEIIEMLAQHLITQPVFEALFEGYSFAQSNPISQAMQQVLDALHEHHLGKEADTLERFYDSVRLRAQGIDSAAGKQRIIVELYDKFFRSAFRRMTDRLGIVYTPVEVVDFIIHSINDVLKAEFGQTLGSKGVHILDPFTGTGTFITRLLQSGLITPGQLAHKYRHEIHANEIVLLAYYIAAINIEAVYHDLMGGDYIPFEGICLTDTFQMHEKDDLVSELLVDNSQRRERQKKLDIRVIMGNPPYSAGQGSASDNNPNVPYPQLDERIRTTYAARSVATNKNALYDSYIRAIRWASDRIGDQGVIGFVTNAGFVEANTADGLRQCLANEFSNIYVFHLRGNQRTSGELSRREGGKIFDSGSRAPIAISILVKNPLAREHGQIYFHDIGDYLNRQEKLDLIAQFQSIAGITARDGWHRITPDRHGDWLNQRDDSFEQHILMGDKRDKTAVTLFDNYSSGVKTQRDAWCYNASKDKLERNIRRLIDTYHSEQQRYAAACAGLPEAKWPVLDDFLEFDPTSTSWTSGLKADFARNHTLEFCDGGFIESLYRPFSKQWLYYHRRLNERVYQMPRIFPDAQAENRVICVTGVGARSFSSLITDMLPCLDNIEKGQCFPLYLYDEQAQAQPENINDSQLDLLSADTTSSDSVQIDNAARRRDAMTDEGLAHFQAAYPGETLSKEDVFYYIYGLLHSPDYRARYADNLAKELPRIPRVKTATDFRAFERAGRQLADLHLNYESAPMYPATVEGAGADADYRVTKMRFGRGKDKTVIQYNEHITIRGIPLEAYAYVVNGKPAIDWVVERQGVSTHKASGIVNDANDWAVETLGNPRYPLELLLRVITVSLETMKIVNRLPALNIVEQH